MSKTNLLYTQELLYKEHLASIHQIAQEARLRREVEDHITHDGEVQHAAKLVQQLRSALALVLALLP
jgi:hypothetical protein